MTLKPTVPVRLTLIIPGVAIIAALVAYFHWTPPTIVAALAALALIGWAAWGLYRSDHRRRHHGIAGGAPMVAGNPPR